MSYASRLWDRYLEAGISHKYNEEIPETEFTLLLEPSYNNCQVTTIVPRSIIAATYPDSHQYKKRIEKFSVNYQTNYFLLLYVKIMIR